MNSGTGQLEPFNELRRQAETLLREQIAATPDFGKAVSAADALRALHELSVHQIELEMQDDELRRTLEALARLTRLYSALSKVNQAAARCSTPAALLDEICQAMVESGNFQLAWIGWNDPEGGDPAVASRWGGPAGAAGPEPAWSRQALLDLANGGPAPFRGRSFVLNDLRDAPPVLPWQGDAVRSGLGSLAAMPLRRRDEVRGGLVVFAAQPEFFGGQELGLLEEAAEAVSFALEHLALESQRRQAEAALAESEARARTMLRTTLDGVWLLDSAWHFLEINDAACGMLGYSRAEMFGVELGDIEAAETPEELREHMDRLVREGADLFESVHRRKDGTLFPVEISVTHLAGQARTVAFVRDISERKRVESALREREQRYRTFFEFGPDGIVVLDPETARPVEFNDQACRQLGYTREEFQGLTMADIEAMESVEQTACRIQAVLKAGIQDFETRQRTRGGEIRDVHVTAQAIQVGGATTYHCVWRDITERKAANRRLREANAKLCSLTLELAETEQRERRHLAQALHDHLQQQLVGATFNLETLGGQIRSRAGQRTLEKLSEAVRGAIEVSRNLTVELSPPVFHEQGLAGGLAWLGREAKRNYGLRVDLDLDGQLEPDSEAARMFSFGAVRELLLNVAKHAKVDRARLSMHLRGDQAIAITVADTGAGFDPGALAVGESPSRGLGLFSILERVRFLGGDLEIASAPGNGSVLTLVVPIQGWAGDRSRGPGANARAEAGEARDADQNPRR